MRNLRIAHVADTHLGYRAAAVPGRDEDFASSWLSACRAIVDSSPDLILHAGDLFHHPNPSWNAVASFLRGAYILQESKAPILMITGNHDSSRLQMKSTVFSVLQGMFRDTVTLVHNHEPILVSLPSLEVDVILLSHPALLNKELSVLLRDITDQLDKSRYSILVAHGDIKSGTVGENTELGSVAIPEIVFEYPWSYVALGHLHLAQPHTQRGWYSGSTERCGWSDFPASPAWTLATLSTGKLRHEQRDLPCRSFLQLPNILCEDLSDLEIYDMVVAEIDQRSRRGERSIARVLLENLSPSRARNLDRSLPSFVSKSYPDVHIQVTTKRSGAVEMPIRSSSHERMGTALDMFKEFVASRTYPDETTKEFIRERGLAALQKAQEDAFGADTGDERTVAVA